MVADTRYPAFLFLGILLTLAGLLLRSSALLGLAVAPFLYALVLLIFRAFLPHPRLDVSRHPAAGRIYAEDDLSIRVRIHNVGPPLALIGIRDAVPAESEVDGREASYLGPMDADATVEFEYTVRPHRGLHPQDSVSILSWSHHGFVFQRHLITCRTSFSAVPAIEPLPWFAIHPRRTHAFAGPVPAAVPGPGVDFYGCRAYTPGDDIRRINWRAVARSQRWIVNEYEQERMTDVILILDVRAQAHIQAGARGTFEPVCRAGASLASHFIRNGNRVGLLTYGRSLDWIHPGGGRFHLERILAAIAKAAPVVSYAFEDLAFIPMSVFPTGSQLILISALTREEDYLVPAQLAARGYSVLVLHPDAETIERAGQPEDEALELAARWVRIHRLISFSFMREHGVHVIPWDVTKSLAATLKAAAASHRPEIAR